MKSKMNFTIESGDKFPSATSVRHVVRIEELVLPPPFDEQPQMLGWHARYKGTTDDGDGNAN